MLLKLIYIKHFIKLFKEVLDFLIFNIKRKNK